MRHGRHIKVLGRGMSPLLADIDRVRSFVADLVVELGMRPLGEPILHDVVLDLAKLDVLPFSDEGGVTGTVVLSTSHIAIHTWPLRHFFVLDVFSRRDFDPETVERCLSSAFGTFALKVVNVDVDYPADD